MSDLLKTLNASAGDAVFERGAAYYHKNKVTLVRQDTGHCLADVAGSSRVPYRVALFRDGRGSCSCPMGQAGTPCKHLVATAFAWQMGEAEPAPAEAPGAAHEPDWRDELARQPAERLAEWLIQLAEDDRGVARQLRFWLSQANGSPKQRRDALAALIGRPRFRDYRQSLEYARRLQSVEPMIRERLEQDDPREAAELADWAIRKLVRIMEESDDSAGAIGEEIRMLSRVFVEACRQGGLVGEELAERLVQRALEDDYDFYPVEALVPLLDEAGLARYGRLVRKAWEALPKIGPGGEDSARFGASLRTDRLMLQFADLTGDSALAIAVHERDLGSGYRFLQLAEALQAMGREREARQRAEQGLALFPDEWRLAATLAGWYLDDGLAEEALSLRWAIFTRSPTAEHYLALLNTAGDDRAAWRDKALAQVAGQERAQERDGRALVNVSLRVGLLLAEGAVREAMALSRQGGVYPHVLEQLAEACAGEDREFCAALRQRLLEQALAGSGEHAYRDAIRQLGHLAPMMAKGEFAALIADIRVRCARRKKFLAMLDAL
ncbi:SWIM zinc finger family protein [Paludibacterium paludis]|uniref:SWIM-type domain-containing protein n=1 Tax=Paludibacterium paludis TaxID=1225769 RepID=A0A918U7M0_9NEIS|nr:DUF6880 family protein [Paludibacterium paludis]GGY05121.1 hypothetical protein GCM10011289_04610 [Paludibacterium paludis]